MLIVDYGGFLTNNFNRPDNDNVLAMYVKYDGITYGLTSFILSDYKKTIFHSIVVGHFAAFFTCNGRFYTNEKEWHDTYMSFGDVNLIENILLGNTEIPTAITQAEKGKFTCNLFNYNKGLRLGIYLPIHLDFDPDELIQMQLLVGCVRKKEMLKALSILCYFTKSMIISVQGTYGKIWSYRTQNMVAWMIATVDKGWRANNPQEILRGQRESLQEDYKFGDNEPVVPFIECINYIETEVVKRFGTISEFKIVTPTQNVKLLIRNLRHERVLINVLSKLDLFT